MNFDERSRHLRTEIGLLIDSAQLAAQTAARFNAMTQLDNAWKRLMARLLAWLPIRHEL